MNNHGLWTSLPMDISEVILMTIFYFAAVSVLLSVIASEKYDRMIYNVTRNIGASDKLANKFRYEIPRKSFHLLGSCTKTVIRRASIPATHIISMFSISFSLSFLCFDLIRLNSREFNKKFSQKFRGLVRENE